MTLSTSCWDASALGIRMKAATVDTIRAVLARRPTRPADFDARMKAVSHFRTLGRSPPRWRRPTSVFLNIMAKSDVTLNDIVHASVH